VTKFWVVIPFVIGIIVFYDIRKYLSTLKAVLIAIFCSFTFPFGPTMYLLFRNILIRRGPKKMVFCPKCGADAAANSAKCRNCGNVLSL